jgi:uncharacterized protein with beta-barrel porin domain
MQMRAIIGSRQHVSLRFVPLLVAGALSASASAETLQTLGSGNTLFTVNSATPGTIASSVPITNIAAGTTLRGIDYRPSTPRVLYGISNVGQIYAINSRSGAATAVGTPTFAPISAPGFDFNPTVDRIRVVSQIGQNVRLVPDTGALAATDGALVYAAADINAGQIPTAAGAAYTNNVAGATTTTLYVIDTRGGLAPARLVTQGNGTVSPNSGTLFTVGSTGVTTASSVGFDISRSGTAFATFTNPTTGVTSLYQVNLATGTATLIGALGGNTTYDGLAIQLASFSSMGATPNQAAVGAVLDNFTGLPSTGLTNLFNGIDGVFATPGAQSAALQALSPAAFSSLPDLSLGSVQEQETAILRYARDLRGNASSQSATTLDAAGKIGMWLVGGSRFGSFDAATDRPRVTSNDFNVLGGIDYRFSPKIAVGGFIGYSKNDANLAPGGSTGDLKSKFAGGYATGAVGPVYLDAWGSYTDLDWGLRRVTAFGTFRDVTTASTDGRVWTGGASAGLSLDYSGFEIEPFAAFRYADVQIDRFSEAGGISALSVGRFDRVSVRTNLGARVGAKLEMAGATIRPQVRGGWYHEFRDQPRTIDAAFVASEIGTQFGFTTTPLNANYYNAGAALNIAGNGPLSLVLDYDAQFDRDREYHSFSLAVRIAL